MADDRFSEFENREWRVLLDPLPQSGPPPKHTPGDIVTFDREADTGVVNVRCIRYGNARYEGPGENDPYGRVIGNGFVIRILGEGPQGSLQIQLQPTVSSDAVGGSWTAEDTGGGINDGE
jgi:hypothetical protein